jgi:hypothetical protein
MSVAGAKVRQKPSTEKKVVFKGLCANCNNAEHCSYARNAKKPVMYCEMYDGYAEEPVRAELSEVLRPDPADLRPEVEMPQSKGLCVNCAHRDTCAWSKREGGVWHCEEYR